MKIITIILLGLMLLIVSLSGCRVASNPDYMIFTMKDGLGNFTFEYSSRYEVKESYTQKDISAVTLIGPFIQEIKDYATIKILISPPDKLTPDAESRIKRAERNASSFPDYTLLEKSELEVDNVPAYRIDFMERNLQPIDRGLSKPPIEVFREVYFDTKGLRWMMQMRSDSSTADSDKPDFEHILQTFKILN
jgi:hypothetical protein